MDRVQIRTEGGKKVAVLPFAQYRRLVSALEAKEDTLDLREATRIMARVQSGEESLIPAAVADAILEGTHPVRAWRNNRKMTAEALASQAGISRAYLTQIENRAREGKLGTLKALAEALGTGVDALVE